MKPLISVLIALSAFIVLPTMGAESEAVRMIGTPMLQPGSTLEFRFQEVMITPDRLGAAESSPIIFEPPLSGTFTWLSTQSGIFLPEGPLPLGESWTMRTSDAWKLPDGRTWDAPFSETASTPAFGVTMVQSGVWDANEVSPDLEVRLAFNAPPSLTAAKKAFHFVNSNGKRIAAEVRHATTSDYFPIPSSADDWTLRWELVMNPGIANRPEDPDSGHEQPLPARLMVSPVEPLGPGDGWTLEAAAGIPSEDGTYRTADPITIKLGTVQPLKLLTSSATHFINSGTSATFSFNRQLAPDIDSNTASKFFSIDPPVEGLSFAIDWQQLTIRGKFKIEQNYTLHVGEDVVAADGLAFDGDRAISFQFGPVAPRVYLPEITGEQLRFGRREFPVRFINLSKLTLIAKRVPLENLPQALQAFTQYQKTEWDEENPDEVYQPVAAELIPGDVIFNGDLEIGKPVTDAAGTVVVDWTKILGAEKPAAVFLTLSGDPINGQGQAKPGSQALVQITDLGVMWKHSAAGLDLQVFSMQSGNPVSEAKTVLLDDEFSEIARADVDATGKVQIPFDRMPAWLSVSAGDDAQVIRMGPDARELPVWSFGLPVAYNSWNKTETTEPDVRGLLFTDRPVYRPGETVHVKGILRRIQGGSLAQANGLNGRFMVIGPRDEQVEAQNVVLGKDGSFSADISASTTNRGEYRIVFRPGNEDFQWWQAVAQTSFLIADYQPDAFAIDLTLPEQSAAGAPVPQPVVTGSYFFGAPLTDARIRWTLQVSQAGFFPNGFEEFDFLGTLTEQPGTLTLRGEGTLADDARFIIPLVLPAVTQAPTSNRLTVEVTDINQQTLTSVQTFKRNASDFYLGIAPMSSNVLKAGRTADIRVVAVLPDGLPTPDPVSFSAKLFRLRNDVVRVKGAGNAVSFQTTTVREPVAETSSLTVIPKRIGEKWSVTDTDAIKFPLDAPGTHVVQAIAVDAGGREVLSESTFYVAGAGDTVWDYRNPTQIDLIADKNEYHPGDTARILVKNPISGEATVSVEQGSSIRRSFSVKLDGNAPVIEIPIEKSDSPNVFISLVVLRGANASKRKFPTPEFRYGLCSLNVINPSDALAVKITPTQTSWVPGETASAEIIVLDASGKPVQDASVTFFAVDDGVLALTGYQRPDPLRVFREPIALAVRTGLTLDSLMPENPTELSFTNKGYLIGGGGQGGPGLKFREDFPGTICWMPDLRTGADGKLHVEFPAPDALTRYRLVAVAHEGVSRFGSAESTITISKPLMLLTGLGSFANIGDTLVARVLVRKQSGSDAKVRLRLGVSDGIQILAHPPATIDIPNEEIVAVDVPIKFTKIGSARLEWSVENETASDALAISVKVGSPMVELRETYLPTLDLASNDLLKGINPQLTEGTGSVRVNVANTRLVGMGEGATYLLEYPYGCAEQTVSAMIPWLVRGLVPLIPELDKSDAKIHTAITVGVDHLFSMQQDSGGIAFWPGSRNPSVFASAWAAVALAKLPDVAMAAPEAAKASLLQFLSESLRTDLPEFNPEAASDRALTLYALSLAGQAEPAYHESLLQIAGSLSEETRCLLALAMMKSGGQNAATAARELLQSRSIASDGYSIFGNHARQLAIRLLATVELDSKSKNIPPLVAELLKLRTNGQWGNTQANAWALLALEAYYTNIETSNSKVVKAVSGEIQDGVSRQAFEVTKARPATEVTLPFPAKKDAPQLVVTNPKKGNLFGQTTFIIHPPLGVQPRQDRGFSISRSYQKIDQNGNPSPPQDLRVGDRILVTLRIETDRAARFVAIDDPLPAILEAVNPDFTSRSTSVQNHTSAPVDYREMLDDRVRFFSDHLPAGAFTYQYLARVRNAGEATAGATKAEEMYRPERFGLGETHYLVSEPAK